MANRSFTNESGGPLWKAVRLRDKAVVNKSVNQMVKMLDDRVEEETEKIRKILIKGRPELTVICDILSDIVKIKPK